MDMCDRSVGIVVESGAAPLGVTLGIVVRDQRENTPTFTDDMGNMVRVALAEVGPAEVESLTEISKGLDDPDPRGGRDRELGPAICT